MTPEQWDAISELFERGLELPPHEREQLLADLDDELAAELRDLWTHSLDQGFLAKPIAKPPTIGRTAPDAPPVVEPAQAAGIYFGPYRTIRLIGQGGMGLVYLAEQEGILNRRVAIKIIKHHLQTAEVLKRFEAERQTLARMDHPGIAKIFDAGTASDGRPYFVMEYVDGPSITDYCDQNLLNHRARLELFRQVCLAVHHAHQKGVIHRDIKPSNVLVTTVDGKPTPRIIDFGIAKAIDRPASDISLFTEHGLLVGTPQYMSPEQAEGETANLDTTSDVYSLGVLMYELLVGATPFDIKELRKLGIAAMHRSILEEDPPSPSARFSALGRTSHEVARLRNTDPGTLLRALRGDIEWILRKALEKNKEMRYPSASEFGEDISRYLHDMAVTASPPSLTYEFRKFARRHRARVAGALAMLAFILISAVVALFLYVRGEKARSQAEWNAYKSNLAAARSNLQEFRAAEARELLLSAPPALRGWEWKHLFWSSDTSLATLHTGQGGRNFSIGFSADGSQLHVASTNAVHVWDLATRRRLHDYGPFETIVAMSGNGEKVAVHKRNSTHFGVEIVEASSGKPLRQLIGHTAFVAAAVFFQDGLRMATMGTDNHIIVWDLVRGRPILQIPPGSAPEKRTIGNPTEQMAVSPEGSRIAVSDSTRVRLLDASSGRQVALLSAHQIPVQSLAFSKDGKRLLSASEFLRIWDAGTGKSIPGMSSAPATPFRGISTAAFHPSLDLAVAAAGTQIQFWNLTAAFIITSAQVPSVGLPRAISFSPDGRFLVFVNTFGVVRIWNGPSLGGQVLRLGDSPGYSSMDLSRDGSKLALSTGSKLEIVDADTGGLLHSYPGIHRLPVTKVVFSPAVNEVTSASNDGQLCTWSFESGSPPRCTTAHSSPVTALLYTPDGHQLISGGADGMVRFWDAKNLSRLSKEYNAGRPVATLAIDPGGKVAIAGLLEQAGKRRALLAQPIDVANAKPRPALEGIDAYRASVRAVQFSPDGSNVYIGDSGSLGVGIWNPHSGKKLGVLPIGGKQGYSNRWSALSPSGDRFVATYGDGSMGIWNPVSREMILQLFRVSALHVQFSRDGSRLYANTGAAIEVFDTRPSISPEAEELVVALETRFPLRVEAREYLRSANIDRKLAEQAIRILDHQPEQEHLVRSLIDDVLYTTNRKPQEYELALRRSQLLADSFHWMQSGRIRLALALYRNGQYRKAIETLQAPRHWSAISLQHRRLILSLAERRLGKPVDLKNLTEPSIDQDPQGRALWEELTSSALKQNGPGM